MSNLSCLNQMSKLPKLLENSPIIIWLGNIGTSVLQILYPIKIQNSHVCGSYIEKVKGSFSILSDIVFIAGIAVN